MENYCKSTKDYRKYIKLRKDNNKMVVTITDGIENKVRILQFDCKEEEINIQIKDNIPDEDFDFCIKHENLGKYVCIRKIINHYPTLPFIY